MTGTVSVVIEEPLPAPEQRRRTPPRWIFNIALVGACFLLLVGFSYPGDPTLIFFVPGLIVIAALFLIWFARLVLCWDDHVRPGWTFLLLPLILTLTVFAVLTSLPLHVRFELSRSAFNARVAGGEPCTEGERIGLYFDMTCRGLPKQFMSFNRGSLSFAPSGFAYVPAGSSAYQVMLPDTDFEVKDLGGGWFAWSRYGPVPDQPVSEDG